MTLWKRSALARSDALAAGSWTHKTTSVFKKYKQNSGLCYSVDISSVPASPTGPRAEKKVKGKSGNAMTLPRYDQ